MQKHKTLIVVLSIAFAVLVPLLNAMKVKMDRASYPVVKFDIEPYDPRDLLYGHYMNFAITWDWKGGEPANNKACTTGDCCLCVGEGDNNPQVSLLQCDAPSISSCKHVIEDYYSGALTDLNRVFVDERIALPLEEIFRQQKEKFSIGLFMTPNGKPTIERLYVGGKPVNEYVDEKGGTLTPPKDDPATP